MTTPLPPTAPQNSIVLATLGPSHSYRFDADSVALTASFRIQTPVAHQRARSLQLWACPSAPSKPSQLEGQLVANVSLPPITEIADPVETFTVNTPALLPAGQRDYVMVLALVATAADHCMDAEIHDIAIYPRRETFVLPRLVGGTVASLVAGDAVITASSIENPRDASNTSGTLSLELWATDQSYNGGNFTGTPVTGIVLGTLAGQCSWTGLNFSLTASLPGKDSHLVLMLREWSGHRYITRDYVNIPEPFIAPTAVATATSVAPAPAPAEKARKSSRTTTVSVNKASETEFAAVKGLSQPLIQAIVAARPFAKLDDLVKVKGIGPKLLAKVRSRLRLN